MDGSQVFRREYFDDMEHAKKITFDYIKTWLFKTNKHLTFGIDELFIIQFSRTLQHSKTWITTTLPDGMYYEVTHNGDDGEWYINAYKKVDKVVYQDEEAPEE